MRDGDLVADFGTESTWITYGIDTDPEDGYIELDTWEYSKETGWVVEYQGDIEWNASGDEQVIIERPSR